MEITSSRSAEPVRPEARSRLRPSSCFHELHFLSEAAYRSPGHLQAALSAANCFGFSIPPLIRPRPLPPSSAVPDICARLLRKRGTGFLALPGSGDRSYALLSNRMLDVRECRLESGERRILLIS
jgi:hypothetical protein